MKLWSDLNTAWLGIFSKQIDLISQNVSRQSPNLIPIMFIQEMAERLIIACDKVEGFGLVDYQYGLEEEKIMESMYTKQLVASENQLTNY